MLSWLVQMEPGEDAMNENFGGTILYFMLTSISDCLCWILSQVMRRIMVERHYTFLIFGFGINRMA